MRTLRWAALALGMLLAGAAASADDFLAGIPRKDVLIVENPEGTIKLPGFFNVWSPGPGHGWSTGLHQLAMDTFWYIDPERGLDGAIDSSLAEGGPQYNADFTQMTVKLRKGIKWSDGVDFTADDVVFTVQEQIQHQGMTWSAPFSSNVDTVTAPDPYTVVFKLKAPNSRFHAVFSVRWFGAWIMPKHVFEKVDDPLKFDFNPPVGLGAYKLHSFDPNGNWYIWQLRDDWKNSSMSMRFGQPKVKYVAYVFLGPPEKRSIEQANHNLDIIHDNTPEGIIDLMKNSKTEHSWFEGFPYAHPDPTLPMVIFNHQNPKFQSADLRWALTLMIDIKQVAMASYRGAATISAIASPPTGIANDVYEKPMQSWLASFEIDTGKRKFKPYDPDIGQQIAASLRPSMGNQVPSDPAAVAKAIGYGWWKHDPKAAGELMEKAGYHKQGGKWVDKNGQPLTINLLVEDNARSVMTRAGSMIVQNWKAAGIDAKTVVTPRVFDVLRLGDFEAAIGWSIETWGGHPDLSFFLLSWHSKFVAAAGKPQPERNWQRWQNPELDQIIEAVQKIDFNDPKGTELGLRFMQLMAREMPIIPLMSYNVETSMDDTYWTGYPSIKDPYTNPVPNWANSRYMMERIQPRQ